MCQTPVIPNQGHREVLESVPVEREAGIRPGQDTHHHKTHTHTPRGHLGYIHCTMTSLNVARTNPIITQSNPVIIKYMVGFRRIYICQTDF